MRECRRYYRGPQAASRLLDFFVTSTEAEAILRKFEGLNVSDTLLSRFLVAFADCTVISLMRSASS